MKNLSINPLLITDAYKVSHVKMEPENQLLVYSALVPRKSRLDGIDKVVSFGFQYFIKEYLINRFNRDFFQQPKSVVIGDLKDFFDSYFGKNTVEMDKFESLHDLGYLPLKIKALPEGTESPIGVPILTIFNTIPGFAWLVNYIETVLQATLWHPITVATKTKRLRKLVDKWADLTSDIPDFVDYQLHTFSMRGCSGIESSILVDAAHCLFFKGSDTLPGNLFHREYYNADPLNEIISTSVPASEHNVMMGFGCDNEFKSFERLINEVFPEGILSIVSDTYDLTEVVNPDGGFLARLKDSILNRNGKIVIRPDSSRKTPLEIICGDPDPHPDYNDRQRKIIQKGLVVCLDEIFGHTVNSKGYKDLHPNIGFIYGEQINFDLLNSICSKLADMGYSSTNGVYGIGSWEHIGMLSRDTFGFAQKATYAEYREFNIRVIQNYDGLGSFIKGINLQKDPITDSGEKKSHKGLLRVNEDFTVKEECTWEEEGGGLLETIFDSGKLIKETTLSEIRERVK